MYYSLQYLPLSDATVITFLAPIVACWACSVLIHEPFTRSEQIAGVVSFLGVILIARPTSFLPNPSGSSPRGSGAHPLISVNYFAAWSTIVSAIALLAVPGIGFRLPANLTQWAYLLFLGICGFVMQFLLTAGLSYEKSSRATNMVYTQMLFALAFDKLVWGTTPGVLSIVGSSLILGSALYVAVHNNKIKESRRTSPEGREEEEVGLMTHDHEEDDSDSKDGRGP